MKDLFVSSLWIALKHLSQVLLVDERDLFTQSIVAEQTEYSFNPRQQVVHCLRREGGRERGGEELLVRYYHALSCYELSSH